MRQLSKKLVTGNKGFTLIEVMIALAIIALGASALQMVLQRSLLDLQRVQEKIMAQFVANNVWTQMQLGENGYLLQAGNLHGVETLADQAWSWSVARTFADTPLVLQIDVDVRTTQARSPFIEMRTYAHQPPM